MTTAYAYVSDLTVPLGDTTSETFLRSERDGQAADVRLDRCRSVVVAGTVHPSPMSMSPSARSSVPDTVIRQVYSGSSKRLSTVLAVTDLSSQSRRRSGSVQDVMRSRAAAVMVIPFRSSV